MHDGQTGLPGEKRGLTTPPFSKMCVPDHWDARFIHC
nr:MAG TPA: hypothetical protein [Caudoviricetes sp.]